MVINALPFKYTGYFSKLITDYLDEKQHLKPFYNYFPKSENFYYQIKEKQQQFTSASRTVLVDVLKKQYSTISTSEQTTRNINLLLNTNTFTVTTGHQLNLFTGPLYFIYKIISTLNLAEELALKYPNYNFVPVYWMATEDHDFDEINHFNFKTKKVCWERAASGAVGDLKTKGLKDVFKVFRQHLGVGDNAKYLEELFKKAYLEHDTLTEATRFLVNELFNNYGLVIIDANNSALKKQFIPYIKDEVVNQTSHRLILKTSEALQKVSATKIQVNPRAINLFYLKKKLRERIVFEDGIYKVVNTKITFTKNELIHEIENNPKRFSPNVVMRPLYQEVILPNLCYIGGGGELAYWLQLKQYFESSKVTFPMLLLRNSALIITEKERWKQEQLNISISDLFLKQDQLVFNKLKELSEISIDFSRQKHYLKDQFEYMYKLANLTDASFLGAVAAQERKQIKGLEHLEKRLIKAQKRKLNDELERVKLLQNKLFPNKSLQERQANFSDFYLEYGAEFITTLKKELHPLQHQFTVLTI